MSQQISFGSLFKRGSKKLKTKIIYKNSNGSMDIVLPFTLNYPVIFMSKTTSHRINERAKNILEIVTFFIYHYYYIYYNLL